MGFLKKVFGFFKRERFVVNVAVGAVEMANPTVGALVRKIVRHVYAAEEKFGAGTGRQKKRYVVKAVEQDLPAFLALAEKFAGWEVYDEKLLARGAAKIIDGVVDVLNATGALAPRR